jgi:hypothetical protein
MTIGAAITGHKSPGYLRKLKRSRRSYNILNFVPSLKGHWWRKIVRVRIENGQF